MKAFILLVMKNIYQIFENLQLKENTQDMDDCG